MAALLLQHRGHTAWSIQHTGARHTRSVTLHAATTSRPTTPPAPVPVQSTQTKETDVVVIGSGTQGSSTGSLCICLLQRRRITLSPSVQVLAVSAVQQYLPSMAFRYGQLGRRLCRSKSSPQLWTYICTCPGDSV